MNMNNNEIRWSDLYDVLKMGQTTKNIYLCLNLKVMKTVVFECKQNMTSKNWNYTGRPSKWFKSADHDPTLFESHIV